MYQFFRHITYGIEVFFRLLMFKKPRCIYCGSLAQRTVGRKFLLLSAKKCTFCGLIYRFPTGSKKDLDKYHKKTFFKSWEKDIGIMSEIRSDKMDEYIKKKFKETKYDYYYKLEAVKKLLGGNSGKMLDYGCGWGYIACQSKELGWDVEGYDISSGYADFAKEKLNILIHTDPEFINDKKNYNKYDVVFSHHVLEHLFNPREILDGFNRLLKTKGYLVLIVPNPGGDLCNKNTASTLGENHVSAFAKEWFLDNLKYHGFKIIHIISRPYVFQENESGFFDTIGVRGPEIMVIAEKNNKYTKIK